MKTYRLFIALLAFPLSYCVAEADDLATFKAQFRQIEASVPEKNEQQLDLSQPPDSTINAILSAQRPDGSWPDINYTDKNRSEWKTADHLKRTQTLAKAYVRMRAAGKDDPALLNAVLSAFRYWNNGHFHNDNWWWTSIGVPESITTIMLLMEDQLTPEDKEAGTKTIGKGEIHGGGTNLAWVEGVIFKKAALDGDLQTAKNAHDKIVGVLPTSTPEGIQPDESYHMHGAQQQNGNYGLALLSDMAAWQAEWRGTSFALTDEQLTDLRNFALQGEAVVVANNRMDISSCDRQLGAIGAPEGKGETVINRLKLLAVTDAPHAAEYLKAIQEDSAPTGAGNTLNKMFYTSDSITHRRPDYYASVKMCSKRVIGGEGTNGDNQSGRYLADGAFFLTQTGAEYTKIFPVWDWHRIPGVTTNLPGGKTNPSGKGETDYAGGVSDGIYGACGLDYSRDGVTGKKGWFFFDHQIVCLGAGLNSKKSDSLVTSMEQCLFKGPAMSATGQVGEGEQKLNGVKWVWHNNRGYYFPDSQDVVESNVPQSGNWGRVAPRPERYNTTLPVFSLWIDHGGNNATYSYVVLPSMTADQVASYAASPKMVILANTDKVQAVMDTEADITEATFYAPGSIEKSSAGTVLVDAPCAIVIRKGAAGYVLTVSDPSHLGKKVTVTLNGKPFSVDLPQGDTAGSSISLN